MKSSELKSYWAQLKSLIVHNGVLKRQWESTYGKDFHYQIVLPASRRNEVLRETHNIASGCHFGFRETLAKLRQRFYWFTTASTIRWNGRAFQ